MRRGEENQRQGGGEIIKGCGTIYTPEQRRNFRHFKSLGIMLKNRKMDILSCETGSGLYNQLDKKNTPS